MNFWIAGRRGPLDQLLPRVDALLINDSEAELLTGERSMILAGRRVQEMGPHTVVIKRGEHGAMVFSGREVHLAPAMPLPDVCDPTGAGDSFAGGFMASVCRTGDTGPEGIRRAVAVGTVVAGACCQAFGPYHMARLTKEEVAVRLRSYAEMVRLPRETGL
ncbi:MAG: hypothetical protein FJ098_08785 [Deltaproteobacteria bacterium]|nr:hypothetical protein [Deltaproteobacteria bacterium]